MYKRPGLYRPDPIPHELAVGLIEAWTRFRIQDMTLLVLNDAMRIRKRFGFSFWDSVPHNAANGNHFLRFTRQVIAASAIYFLSSVLA